MQVFEDYLTETISNIAKIENSVLFDNLLDKTLPTMTINVTDNNILCAASVCVLLCAEFESYFENIAKEITLIAKSKWENSTSRELTRPFITLLADKEYKTENSSLKEILYLQFIIQLDNSQRITFISKLVDTLRKLEDNYTNKTIENNSGAKLDNLKKLYLPLGVPIEKLHKDNGLIFDSLENLGKDRGNVAHNSHTSTLEKVSDTINALDKKLIQDYIRDCKKICELVKDAAIVLCNQPGLVL